MEQREIRALAKEEFDKLSMFKDNPIAWSAWKMAFDIAWSKSKKNLSNMIMSDGDIFEVCKNEYLNDYSSLKASNMNSYLKGAKMQRDYWQSLLIKSNNNEKTEK